MSTLFRHVCYQCLVMCQKDHLFFSVLANLSTYCDWNLFFDSGCICLIPRSGASAIKSQYIPFLGGSIFDVSMSSLDKLRDYAQRPLPCASTQGQRVGVDRIKRGKMCVQHIDEVRVGTKNAYISDFESLCF